MKHTLRAAAFAAALLPLIPHASETSGSEAVFEMQDLVVTADLWETAFANTSASISLLEADRFLERGDTHFGDLVSTLPNVTWTGGTSRPRYIQIRGIGENSQFEGETPDSAVRFLIDDLDFTGIGGVGALFDTKQVEVLRGPQAGAFGANAAGGVVRIVSNRPTPEWQGQAELTGGTDDLVQGGFAVGGGLVPDAPELLMTRVSVVRHRSDGFRDNRFTGSDSTNRRDELVTRARLVWNASDAFELDGTLFYADLDNGYDEFSLDNTGFDTFSDRPGEDNQESLAGSLRATLTGDAVELTSVTTATTTDSLYSYDADWTDATDPRTYNGFNATRRERLTAGQDLRIDSIDTEDALGIIDRWTLGLYVSGLDEDTRLDYADDFGAAAIDSEFKARNAALFGQAAHHFTDSTRLILGLRGEYYQSEVDSAGTSFGFPVGGNSRQSDPLFGGKLTLEQDLAGDSTLFASLTRGYKAGGANVGAFLVPGDPLTYDPETLWNAELGVRALLFGGAVRTAATAFYLHREDTQLRDSVGAGGFFRYQTVNGGTARIWGLETEAEWFATETVSLYGNLGLMDSWRDAYTLVNGAGTTAVPARELSNVPNFSYTLGLRYARPEGPFANAEVIGRDAYFESNSHNEKRSAFAVVNASVGWRFGNGFTLSLWSRNLFDADYEKRVFFFANDASDGFTTERRYESPADPRQVGLTANYTF